MADAISFRLLVTSMVSKGNQMGDFGSPLSTGDPVLMSQRRRNRKYIYKQAKATNLKIVKKRIWSIVR